MNYNGNTSKLVVVVVVVVNDHSWKASRGSFFGRSAGRLSLSLRLTQGKPLGCHDSNSRCRR